MGFSCISFLGDYTEGGIYIYDKSGKNGKLFDTKDSVLIFNGGLLFHKTQNFTGNRFALIYYKQKNAATIPGLKMIGSGLNDDDIDENDIRIY